MAQTQKKIPLTLDEYLQGLEDLLKGPNRSWISFYNFAKECEASGTWLGTTQSHSFARFLEKHVGVGTERWRNMCAVVDRFSRKEIEDVGFDSLIHLLTVPAGSPEEKNFWEAYYITKEKLGHELRFATTKALINKYRPQPKKASKKDPSTADLLRMEIRNLTSENSQLKKDLEAEKKAHKITQGRLDYCRKYGYGDRGPQK